MDEMITFEKDYEERLDEYMVVFGDDILASSDIKKQWSIHMEFILDSCGWQALWKIPRLLCDKLDIPFPTVVIVYVNSINYEDLTVEVQIIAVQGNIDLPLNHTATLTRLWPTKQQPDESIDIISIANVLDMYRFFYYHLWMPWDLQESNDSDWVRSNLTDRLHLFFHVKDGNIPKNKARRFRSLLTEVKTLLECLGDDGTASIRTDIPNNAQDSKTDMLIDLHLKIADIKTEIEILQFYQFQNNADITKEKDYWLIFNSGCTLDKYTEFLLSIQHLVPSGTDYKSAVCLQDALDSANSNDYIIIGAGKHKIHAAGVLDDGAVLKSELEDRTQVVIVNICESSFVDFSGKHLTLENLCVNIALAQCGIIAQTGSILIKNCEIIGQGSSSNQHGIVALPGADIKIENCHISGFKIGFYVSSFASLTLTNCTISDVQTPIKIYANAIIDLNNCKFLNYEKYSIYLESKELEQGMNAGDIAVLQSKINAKIVNCTFESAEINDSSIVDAMQQM